MIKNETAGRTLTHQHLRDVVEISYTQACSSNYPTAYGCVLRARFRGAHNCTEAGPSGVRAQDLGTALCRGLPTSMGSPYVWIGGDSRVSADKIHGHQLPARSALAPEHMENAKIHFLLYTVGILPVLERRDAGFSVVRRKYKFNEESRTP